MDSLEDSASMKNPARHECDSEMSTICKSTTRQRGASDNRETVFTSMSNQMDSSCVVRTINLNPLMSTDSGQQLNRQDESSSNRIVCGSSQSQTCNRSSSANIVYNDGASTSKVSVNAYDNGVEGFQEIQSCQRHKVCLDKAGNSSYNSNAPSTSGSSKQGNNPCENSTFRENRKRPSSLKLNRPNLEADDSSSDTGNDDYSLGSEDGCIYTYRGGEHLADLPSSFFSLDMGLPLEKHLPMPLNYPGAPQVAPNVREQGSRASSPDMDFLEMDFDPGPSCEVDDDESTPDVDLEAASSMPEEAEPVIRGTSPEYLAVVRHNLQPLPSSSHHVEVESHYCSMPSTSRGIEEAQGKVAETNTNQTYGPYITHVNARGEQFTVRRTMSQWPQSASIGLHVSSGDLVSPREILNYEEEHPEASFAYQINQGERPIFDSANLSSALYHLTMAKRLMVDKTKSNIDSTEEIVSTVGENICEAKAGASTESTDFVDPPRCMVWSEREACERQVTQIATSACGATAVVNVFIALGVPVNSEKINSAIGTRQRANNAPLPRYLLSRAVAGCTAADLVTGIQRASDGLVTARFLPTFPERAVSLSHWLADWISLGAVPILTLNLQMGCEGEIPDAWHHQMVFGVSSRGIYLCNPVECVPESSLWPRLNSPSVILVRTRDVLARFTASTDLMPLMAVPERRFHTFNVLGQVVNVIREWRSTGWSEHGTRTRHVRIPASYQAGVTIVVLTGSEAHRRLMHAPQLPILGPETDNK